MSAPDTNLNKQKRRHRVPLIAMGVLVVFFVILMLVYWPIEEAAQAPGPDGADAQVDGRTGIVTDTDTGNGFTGTVTPEQDGAPVQGVAPEPLPPVVDPALDPLVEDPVVPGTSPQPDGTNQTLDVQNVEDNANVPNQDEDVAPVQMGSEPPQPILPNEDEDGVDGPTTTPLPAN